MDSLEVLLESTIPLDRADDVADVAQWRSHMAEERRYIESRHARLERQFEDWPSPFRTLPLRWNEDDPWLAWQASEGASSYTLKYGKDPQFLDSDVQMAEGLTGHGFCPAPGIAAGTVFLERGGDQQSRIDGGPSTADPSLLCPGGPGGYRERAW